MRLTLIILGIIAVMYIAFVVLLFVMQDRFLYFPRAELRSTPRDVGLDFDEVDVVASDNVRLHGWYVPRRSSRGTVLFCHGNGGNLSSTVEAIAAYHALGFSVLAFDYRGYGKSEGRPFEEGMYRDAERMWEWLTVDRGQDASTIVVVGRSLGSGPATWLATRHRPGALILESPFTSMAAMGARQFPFAPVRLLIRHRFDNLERIPRVQSPLLVVHSRDDALIPVEQGRALYEAAPSPKEFVEIRFGHNEGFGLSAGAYRRGVDEFLKRVGR